MPRDIDRLTPGRRPEGIALDAHIETAEEHPADRHFVNQGVEPLRQKEFDVEELSTKLGQWKQAWDDRDDMIVAPEDGVRYEDVIRAMDVASAAGFTTLSMADGAACL